MQLNAEPSAWTYKPQVIIKAGTKLGRAGHIFLETIGAQTS